MRIIGLVFFFLLSAPSVFAQEKDKWQRITTLDGSVIEMNVSTVVFSTGGIGRVKFRFSFSKPEPVSGMPGVKYQSFIETIEFKCSESQYRLYEVTLFNSKGDPIRTDEKDSSAKWKDMKTGKLMHRLSTSACQFIAEKRRNP
jgi:hypothetical protein